MGVTKTETYTQEQIELVGLLKALAHPARLAIFEHLLEVNACICNDLLQEIDLAQPTISQHLKEMKTAGLIKGQIEGKTICYCIDDHALKKITLFMEKANLKMNTNCC